MASNANAVAPPIDRANPPLRTPDRSTFFVGFAVVLLALVSAGFGRTYFLRRWFDVPEIPWYLYVHATALASWFLLLVVQTSLVVARRTDLHRRFGIAGAFLAPVVVVTSAVSVLGLPARSQTANLAYPLDETAVRLTVWADLSSLVTFSTLVALALLWRRRPEVHKRLMLLASLPLVGSAVSRLPLPGQPAVQGVLMLALPLTIVLRDVIATRRVHPATIGGMAVQLVTLGVFQWIGMSAFGGAFLATIE